MTTHLHAKPRRPFAGRVYPEMETVLSLLGALRRWPQARERFRSLAISVDAIENPEARAIAHVFLLGEQFTDDEFEIVTRDDGERVSWRDAIKIFETSNPDWAVATVNRFARDYAGRWLPERLNWVGERMRTGGWDIYRVALEILPLLALATPPGAKRRVA